MAKDRSSSDPAQPLDLNDETLADLDTGGDPAGGMPPVGDTGLCTSPVLDCTEGCPGDVTQPWQSCFEC